MGGCYGKWSKKMEEDGKLPGNAPIALPFRPYFRQHSADESPYVGGFNDVWVKREDQYPAQNEPMVSKETVLHEDWWKYETIYKDSDKGNFTRPPEEVRRILLPLPPIPTIPIVYVDDSDDLTYNTIGEVEMEEEDEEPYFEYYETLPPLSVSKGIPRSLPEEKTTLHDDEKQPSSSFTRSPVHVRRSLLPPPPILTSPIVSVDDSDDDTYNTFSEAEMEEENEETYEDIFKTLPPLSVSKDIPRSLPEEKTTLYDDEKQSSASPSSSFVDKPTQQNSITTNDQSDGEPEHTQYGEKVTEEQNSIKCSEYSEMVKIFKPLIIPNVRIHDILPHLSFLDNHEDIYELKKNHSEKEAVLTMLEQLDKCNTLGKWQKFIDVLSACGYTYIVDNIRGYKFITHNYQTEYIKILTPKIKNMIIPNQLIPYLEAKSLISDTDRENILSDCNRFGNIHGAITLLDRVTRKHRNWYMLFIEALEEARFEEVATDLRIEKLMGNGRVKDTDRVRLADSDDVPPPIPHRIPFVHKHHQVNSGVADDNIESNGTMASNMNNETDEPAHEAAQFSYLEDEISTLKHEEQELKVETSLLEKKSYHYQKVVGRLKKKNQLKSSIALMEKEREALRNAPITIEENHADQLSADMYYPGRHRSHGVFINRVGVLDRLNDLSVDAQALALNTDSAPSPVPVYSPSFNKTKMRLLPSDSGMGASDVYYEEMGDIVN